MSSPLCGIECFPSLYAPQAQAQSEQLEEKGVPRSEQAYQALPRKQTGNGYILGPGDSVLVELLDVRIFRCFYYRPAGTIYLPRLHPPACRGPHGGGTPLCPHQQFGAYVRDPQVFVSPTAYRPIRVYIGGEVAVLGTITYRAAVSRWNWGRQFFRIDQYATSRNSFNPKSTIGPATGGNRASVACESIVAYATYRFRSS